MGQGVGEKPMRPIHDTTRARSRCQRDRLPRERYIYI